jgi:hypothetical protein
MVSALQGAEPWSFPLRYRSDITRHLFFFHKAAKQTVEFSAKNTSSAGQFNTWGAITLQRGL